jgi:peptide/nickel transport system substrate-binding protein
MGEGHAARRTRLIAVALLILVALIASACGGGGDDGGDDEGAQPDNTSPPNVTVAAGDPVEGGSLTFGLEAETDGWDPTANRWAVSGFIVANTVFDPLATYNADGEIVPYLAKAFVPNDDFTQWDIQLREGVKFHNGEPLNADAVAQLIEAHRASGLSGPVFAEVETVEVVDDLTVRVSMATPWSSFPVVLTAQTGYVPAPAQLADPEGARNPIGTGPFTFEEWTPSSQFVVSKNEDYWQEGLPYLDEVVFKPITDQGTRLSSLDTGEIDVTHTTDDELIVDGRKKADDGDAQII